MGDREHEWKQQEQRSYLSEDDGLYQSEMEVKMETKE